ncbi:MAG: flavodoxin family protein [Deltaproteobacteria bacterium]|jgi:multimeric flavodoxin WrbA|nr:flavodoxin family protein [Deltaproteobacteria bacterium]
MRDKILVLHDLDDESLKEISFGEELSEETEFTFFAALPKVAPCRGCFGCWVLTPGKCVINDRGASFTAEMRMHEELIIVSELILGGYSPAIKAVLDRSIGYLIPFIHTKDGKSVHNQRIKKDIYVTAAFYGEASPQETALAERLFSANALNLGARSFKSLFFPSPKEIIFS